MTNSYDTFDQLSIKWIMKNQYDFGFDYIMVKNVIRNLLIDEIEKVHEILNHKSKLIRRWRLYSIYTEECSDWFLSAKCKCTPLAKMY